MRLDEKIRKLRTDAGLSQQQLADALHVSRAAVAKWENDNGTPDVENLKALAAYFHCDLDRLLDDNRDLEPDDAPNSYCGKDCGTCTNKEATGCAGCFDGPGGQYRDRCEIAACCRNYRRSSCEGCTSYGNCLRLANSAIMPQIRERKEQESRERAKARTQRAKFLKNWLWLIFLLLIPRLVASLFTAEPISRGLPVLGYVGEGVLILCSLAQGLIYLRISLVQQHFKYAGYFYLGTAGVELFLLLLTGGEVGDITILLTTIPSLLLQLFCLYNECRGYSEIVTEFDYELSEKWINLWYIYGGCTGALLLSIPLLLIFRALGAVVMVAAYLGVLYSAIRLHILRYKTAKEVSFFA